MSGEAPNNQNKPSSQATAWDSLADYDAVEQNLQDEFLNIEDMLNSGRITEEQAEHFREEVTARAAQANENIKAQEPELDPEAKQYLEDELLNIEDMLNSGRITEEQAEHFREEVTDRALQATIERAAAQDTAPEQEAEPQEEPAKAPEGADVKPPIRGTHARVTDDALRAKLERAEHAELEAKERERLEAEERAKLERAKHANRSSEATKEQEAATEQLEEREALISQIDQKISEIDDFLGIKNESKNSELIGRIDQKIAEINDSLGIKDSGEVESRIDQIDQKIAEIDAFLATEGEEEEEDFTPLVAINADFTHDKKEFARTQAEQELNDELSTANFIKRIWKGNLFRKYYQKKYEREYLSGERVLIIDGEENDVDDVIADRSGSAIKRFVLGTTDEYGKMVHTKAGESLTEADARTTEAVKDAIEWFASAEVPEGGSIADLNREFGNRVRRIQAEGRDQGQPIDQTLINNYYEVAMQARQRVEHGAAMERVMDGFKVYNADVRDGVRTEAHRDNIDKIINAIESHKIGQFVPAEAIAAAVGTAWGLTQVGAKAAVGVFGALGIAGASQGLRARNRVTEDRARMMRDIAAGYDYDGTSGDEVEGHAAKKRAKYEARIGGTLYDIRPASELTQNLTNAIQSGDHNDIVRAIAEARVRIDYSDAERKDLIGYSSDDTKGDERLALDLAVIRAENSLSARGQEDVAFMNGHILHHIAEDIDTKDAAFRRLRAVEAAKAAGKSVAIGAAAFFGSQEAIAALDPGKIGIFEKAGLLKTENADDASETILAGLAGPRTRTQILENIEGDRTVEIDRYKEDGWEQIEVEKGWTETKQDVVSTSPAASDHQVRVAYDGWANNGTTISDSNELDVNFADGHFVSSMSGHSTMSGEAFDYDQLAESGRIKGYLTIGGAKFEIASNLSDSGQLTWGEDGTFTTTTGETIKAIGDNGEKLYQYFEVALDNGTDADGVTHIMPFATEVGSNTFNGTIDQVADTTVEHYAVYNFAKEVPREVSYEGVAVPGVTSRVGVGPAYQTDDSSDS